MTILDDLILLILLLSLDYNNRVMLGDGPNCQSNFRGITKSYTTVFSYFN